MNTFPSGREEAVNPWANAIAEINERFKLLDVLDQQGKGLPPEDQLVELFLKDYGMYNLDLLERWLDDLELNNVLKQKVIDKLKG